jgi:DNA-binding CsgD family transcriptional regulator
MKRRSHSDLLQLVNTIYSTGLGERGWNDGLKTLADFFGAAAAVTIDVARANGQIPVAFWHGYNHARFDEYAKIYHQINPRMHSASERPGPHTTWDYDKISPEEMRRSEYYNWLERECGVRYFIGSRTIDGDDYVTFAEVDFKPSHGHAGKREIETFKLISPHLANAWRISRMFGELSQAKGAFGTLQEAVQWGVIGLDLAGRVCSMNERARGIVARADGLKVVRGSMRLLRAAEDRTLSLIVAHTLRAVRGEGIYPGGSLSVPRTNGRLPYAVRVLPIRASTATPAPETTPVALVLISDPDTRNMPARPELMSIFGLSEREAELAQQLALGLSLDEAADRMRIARNTARVHLSSILAKTGARGQAALIGLLSSLPASPTTDWTEQTIRPIHSGTS